jgi:hypothetical protein
MSDSATHRRESGAARASRAAAAMAITFHHLVQLLLPDAPAWLSLPVAAGLTAAAMTVARIGGRIRVRHPRNPSAWKRIRVARVVRLEALTNELSANLIALEFIDIEFDFTDALLRAVEAALPDEYEEPD